VGVLTLIVILRGTLIGHNGLDNNNMQMKHDRTEKTGRATICLLPMPTLYFFNLAGSESTIHIFPKKRFY
jgi:hypothetical protein